MSGDDGILVRDTDGDGRITTTEEIFAGPGAIGFDALRGLDSNGDHVLDANDAAFPNLLVWRDADEDARVDEGELASLASHGITQIALPIPRQSMPIRPRMHRCSV